MSGFVALSILVFLTSGAAPTLRAVHPLNELDLAVCRRAPPRIEGPLNGSIVEALIRLDAPRIFECLTSSASRTSETAEPVVALAVKGTRIRVSVSGKGLGERGVRCIRDEVERWARAGLRPEPSDSASVKVRFQYGTSRPHASPGAAYPLEVPARVRLAEPSWCECLKPLAKAKLPVTLGMRFDVKSISHDLLVHPAYMTDHLTGRPAVDEATACVAKRIQKMRFRPHGGRAFDLHLPIVDSGATAVESSASASLRFIQSIRMLGRQGAEVLLAAGRRDLDMVRLNRMVQQLQSRKHRLDDAADRRHFEAACKKLDARDGRLLSALEQQSRLATAVHEIAAKQRGAGGSAWAGAEKASARTDRTIRSDVSAARGLRHSDEEICRQIEQPSSTGHVATLREWHQPSIHRLQREILEEIKARHHSGHGSSR